MINLDFTNLASALRLGAGQLKCSVCLEGGLRSHARKDGLKRLGHLQVATQRIGESHLFRHLAVRLKEPQALQQGPGFGASKTTTTK